MRKIVFLALVLIVLIGGCAASNQKETALPVLEVWKMSEVQVFSPEGFFVKEGLYESGEKIVKLIAVSSDDEIKTRNMIESLAYKETEGEVEKNKGMIGEKEAELISDEQFKIVYFADGKTGYIGISDNFENLKDFFSGIYENVIIET